MLLKQTRIITPLFTNRTHKQVYLQDLFAFYYRKTFVTNQRNYKNDSKLPLGGLGY